MTDRLKEIGPEMLKSLSTFMAAFGFNLTHFHDLAKIVLTLIVIGYHVHLWRKSSK